MKRLLAALACALGALSAQPALAACEAQKADLPVTLEGTRPIVKATINGHDVRLLVDSGAAFSVLDEDVAKSLGLTVLMTNAMARGGGGEFYLGVARLRDFKLGSFNTGGDHAFFVAPRAGAGGDNAGLLGSDFLRNYDVDYDLAHGLVRLLRFKNCADANLAYWASAGSASVLRLSPYDATQPHLMSTIIINGVSLRAIFDTGAARSTLDLHAARRLGLVPGEPKMTPAGLSYGLGRRPMETWRASLDTVQIGDEKILNTQMLVANFEMANWDILLGADFFLSHHVLASRTQNKLYFTYNGSGAVFRLDDPAKAASPAAKPASTDTTAKADRGESSDAMGSARGALAHRNFGRAIVDYTRAIDTAPTLEAYVGRGEAHLGAQQPEAAREDLDAALKLEPDNLNDRLRRSVLAVQLHDAHAARADLAEAERLTTDGSSERGSIAQVYGLMGDFDRWQSLIDRWIAASPHSEWMAAALTARCAGDARAGVTLDRAITDCDKVVRMGARSSDVYAARGLAYLTRGDLKLAAGDFDSALKLQPQSANALYGRSLAERRQGLTAAADADIAAAERLNPKIAEVVGPAYPAAVFTCQTSGADHALGACQARDAQSAPTAQIEAARLKLEHDHRCPTPAMGETTVTCVVRLTPDLIRAPARS